MKILLSTLSMSYLSGAPLYNYELARELKRQGHDITVVSDWDGPLTGKDGFKLKENLEKDEIKIRHFGALHELDSYYDLIIASEQCSQAVIDVVKDSPVINIVHSEYDCETPLNNSDRIIRYVCIRKSISEHIVKEHDIPQGKCIVIYNGVDRTRFRPIEKTPRDYYKVVVPCTLDTLREKFLNDIIATASEKKRIFIYGFDCGAKLIESEYVSINPDKFDIEEEIADADEVVGILLGRVNLEAWSCGVPSRIYDPDTLENRLYDPPVDFDSSYNIEVVAKKIVDLLVPLDDITFVIPHYDRTDKLKDLLDDLRHLNNVVVSKNGSFSRSCNIGFNSVRTKWVCFLNDDLRISSLNVFRQLKVGDICGAKCSEGCSGFNIVDGKLTEIRDNLSEIEFPSGACLMVKSDVFKALGGFSEKYVNGCEDVDLYLRAKEKGYEISVSHVVVEHHEGSSSNRYDMIDKNIEIFNKKWEGICKI